MAAALASTSIDRAVAVESLECLSWFPGEISFNQDLIARIEAACEQPTYRPHNAHQVVYMAIREWFALLDVAARERVLTALLAYSLGHVDELRTQNTERSEDSAVVVSFIRRLLLGASPSEGSLIDKLAAIRHGVSVPPAPLAPLSPLQQPQLAPVAAVSTIEPLTQSIALRAQSAVKNDSTVFDERDLLQDPMLRTEILAAFRELFGITKVDTPTLLAIISRIDSTDLIETYDSPSNQTEFKQSAERELRIFSIVLDYFEANTGVEDVWVIDQAREQLLRRLSALPPLQVVVANGESSPELVIAHPSVHVVTNRDVFILFSREGGVYELPIEHVMSARHGDSLTPKLLPATQSRVLKTAFRDGVFEQNVETNVNYTLLHRVTAVTQALRLPEKISFTGVVNKLAQMTNTFAGRVMDVIRAESDFSDFAKVFKRAPHQQTGLIPDSQSINDPEVVRHRHIDYRALDEQNEKRVKASSSVARPLTPQSPVQVHTVMVRSIHSSLKLHGGIEINPDDNLYYPIEGYKWKSPDDPHNFMIMPLAPGETPSPGKKDPYQGQIPVNPKYSSAHIRIDPRPEEKRAEQKATSSKPQKTKLAKLWDIVAGKN